MTDILLISKIQMGYLASSGAFFYIIGAVIFSFICHKITLKKLLVYSIVISAITSLCYLYFPGIKVAFVYGAVFGVFGSISHLAVLSYAAKVIPKQAEAIFFSFLMSILNLASSSSSMLGGYLYPLVGLKVLMIISCITTLLCLFFIPFINKE